MHSQKNKNISHWFI